MTADAGGLLRAARQRAGLSQRQLAQRAGTGQGYISYVERGLVSPSVNQLDRLLRRAWLRTHHLRERGGTMKTDHLQPGQRVRLHSGRDTGTVVKIGQDSAVVHWDSGKEGAWHKRDLVPVAEDAS